MINPAGTKIRSRWPVLVAIEDLTLRERIYDLLILHGFAVTTAPSDGSTLDILKLDPPAIVLTEMPRMSTADGQLIRGIRALDADLPILILENTREAPRGQVREHHQVQAALPMDVDEETLLMEIYRWLKAPMPEPRARAHGMVLIVDDEPKVRELLQEFLASRDFTVLTAASGGEALVQLQRYVPSIVLLDIKMPGMDGLLTLRKMKAVRSGVAVVMMTALEDEGLMAQAFMFGAYEYVRKPFDFRYLESVLVHLSQLVGAS